MELPNELWIIIKNYLFDYQKYWKNKFNNVLKSKILNEIRETSYFNLPTVPLYNRSIYR